MTGKSCSTALGLPGKLTISVDSAMPEIPRVRMPSGVWRADSARIASASPGASRWITTRVASGVMSSGVMPVPPVVKIRSQSWSTKWCSRSSISAKSSGTTSIPTTSQPAFSASAASTGPERSSAERLATEVETVRIAARMGRSLGRQVAEALHVDVPARQGHAGADAAPLDLDGEQRCEGRGGARREHELEALEREQHRRHDLGVGDGDDRGDALADHGERARARRVELLPVG